MCGDCFVCIYLVCQCDGLELGRRNRRITVRGVAVRINTNAPYITKLANLHKEKNVLKQILSQHRTGIDLSSSIAYQVCDGHDFLVPETIPECQQRCREAQQEIRQLEKDSVILRVEEQTRLHREAIQCGDHDTAKAIKYHLAAE